MGNNNNGFTIKIGLTAQTSCVQTAPHAGEGSPVVGGSATSRDRGFTEDP